MRRLAWITLCWLAVAAGPTLAQDRGVSYSTWMVSGNVITLRFLLPVSEAQRLTGAGLPVLTTARLEAYLLQHLSVGSAGGDCPAIDQGYDLGRVDPLAVGADLFGFEILFRCNVPRQLVLRNDAAFARAPGHVDFARIQMHGVSVDQLFTAQHRQLALPDDRALEPAGFGAYLRLGVTHVAGSADRWCFLIGMLLLVRRRRDLGYLALAVAGGYLLALLLFMTSGVLPRLVPLQAFMGFLVALLGTLIAQRESQAATVPGRHWPAMLLLLILAIAALRFPSAIAASLGGAAITLGFLLLPPSSNTRLTLWPGAMALFTFLDGFVLPAVLPPAQLPPRSQLQMLIGFDLGAVSLDTVLLALALAAGLLLRNRSWAMPRAVVQDVGAAGLTGLGTFWLLSRLG